MQFNVYRDFENGTRLTALGYDIVVRQRRVGPIELVSGRLVACDPLEAPESEPFSRELPAGSYPVTLTIAEMRDEDVIAYAAIHLTDAPATRWEVATVEGERERASGPRSLLRDEGPSGYGVFSNVGCFMDLRAADLYLHRLQDALFDEEEEDDEITDRIYTQLRKRRDRGPGWANVELAPGCGNIIAFDAGYGAGFYVTRVGFDADGNPTRIVTDFRVLDCRFPTRGVFGARAASSA
jgi:hypothetical protein